MKKLIVLFIVMCSFIPLSWAMDGCNQHLSPDEFRAKQKAYITEKAGLTKEEAAKFFPVYFELQDRKKQLNDEAWNLLRKGRDEKNFVFDVFPGKDISPDSHQVKQDLQSQYNGVEQWLCGGEK